jgi:DNA excision repair protein ERCC-4
MFHDIFSKKNLKKEKIKLKIIIDIHEKNSLVPSIIKSHDIELIFKHLEIGDYLVNDIVIERKTINDFVSSMISKRLDNQLDNLKEIKERLLIIEGNVDGLKNIKINNNAIQGKILSILLKNKIPIIFTQNHIETANYLEILLKKQNKEPSSNRFFRKKSNINEQKQNILESFPNIGPKTAKKLMDRFGNLENIFKSDKEQLSEILKKRTDDFLRIIKE